MGSYVHLSTQTKVPKKMLISLFKEFGIQLCKPQSSHPKENYCTVHPFADHYEMIGVFSSRELFQLLIDQLEVFSKGVLAEIRVENRWETMLPNHSYEFREGLNEPVI